MTTRENHRKAGNYSTRNWTKKMPNHQNKFSYRGRI